MCALWRTVNLIGEASTSKRHERPGTIDAVVLRQSEFARGLDPRPKLAILNLLGESQKSKRSIEPEGRRRRADIHPPRDSGPSARRFLSQVVRSDPKCHQVKTRASRTGRTTFRAPDFIEGHFKRLAIEILLETLAEPLRRCNDVADRKPKRIVVPSAREAARPFTVECFLSVDDKQADGIRLPRHNSPQLHDVAPDASDLGGDVSGRGIARSHETAALPELRDDVPAFELDGDRRHLDGPRHQIDLYLPAEFRFRADMACIDGVPFRKQAFLCQERGDELGTNEALVDQPVGAGAEESCDTITEVVKNLPERRVVHG